MEDQHVILKEHPTQPLSFTFVPVVRKLPTHAYVHSGNCGQPKCKPNEHFGTQEEMASDMLQHDIFKAEIVFIGDSEDEGEDAPAHHHCLEQTNDIARIEPQLQFKSSATTDHMSEVSLCTHPVPAEKKKAEHPTINVHHFPESSSNRSDNKHQQLIQSFNNTSHTAPVYSSLYRSERVGEREMTAKTPDPLTNNLYSERLIYPASSKESILSGGPDRVKSLSALHLLCSEGSQGSLSRTESPCSSIRSGMFSPALVKIVPHSLSSSSSLFQASPSCFSPTGDSFTPSPFQVSQSTTLFRSSPRPPLTQLSLLTAILRTGQRPHSSTAHNSLQRPFSPSWPASAVSLLSSNTCSVTSSLTSMSFEASRPQSPSSAEKPLQVSPAGMHRATSASLKYQTPASPSCRTEAMPHSHPAHSPKPACPSQDLFKCSPRNLSPVSQNCSALSRNEPVSPAAQQTLKQISSKETSSTVLYPITPSSFSRCDTLSPRSSSLAICTSERHDAASPTPAVTSCPTLSCNQSCSKSPLQNRISLGSSPERFNSISLTRGLSLSPRPNSVSASPSPCPSSFSTLSHSQRSYSFNPTANCLTPSPSPHGNSGSTPSPSPSLPPVPSPTTRSVTSPFSIECETKNPKEYKIKSSYKAFAAIPSNILLLEQKAIDEEVDNPVGAPVEDNKVSETHAEMCSPAQLRQQSEELYATIDQVLEEPMPMQRSHSVPISLQKLMDSDAPKNFTTLPRSAGRETKYATSHLLPSGFAEKQLTKPGVIRPVAVIAREKEKHQPNPFRQYLEETSDAEQRLSLSPSFLTSFVSHPTFYHHLCQTILSPRNISLSKPLSFSSVKCLTPGPYIHLSSIIQPNYQTNLPLSLGSLYNKPQHPIVTIHENEALSSKELNTVRGLSRTDATGCPGIPKMRLQDRPDEHSHVLLQIREEEEEEEDEKVNSSSTA